MSLFLFWGPLRLAHFAYNSLWVLEAGGHQSARVTVSDRLVCFGWQGPAQDQQTDLKMAFFSRSLLLQHYFFPSNEQEVVHPKPLYMLIGPFYKDFFTSK